MQLQLAQINLARTLATLDSPAMTGFGEAIARANVDQLPRN
jgi:hypothetical protein